MAYRCICGLPYRDMVLDWTYTAHAEAASDLLARLNKGLTHTPENPGMPDEEYRLGAVGRSSSNLFWRVKDDRRREGLHSVRRCSARTIVTPGARRGRAFFCPSRLTLPPNPLRRLPLSPRPAQRAEGIDAEQGERARLRHGRGRTADGDSGIAERRHAPRRVFISADRRRGRRRRAARRPRRTDRRRGRKQCAIPIAAAKTSRPPGLLRPEAGGLFVRIEVCAQIEIVGDRIGPARLGETFRKWGGFSGRFAA